MSDVHYRSFSPVWQEVFQTYPQTDWLLPFSHFWRAVLSLASLTGRKNISKMAKLFGDRRTRQAIAHFLTEAEWNAPEILLDSALSTLKRLGWKPGDKLYLVADDTQKQKCGKPIVLARQREG